MKYIKLFATKELRYMYEESDDYNLPYVSLEEETNSVNYPIVQFADITIESGMTVTLEDGSILDSGIHTINMTNSHSVPFGIINGKDHIKEVDLFDYMADIQYLIFEGFTNLKKIYLNKLTNEIPESAFNNCINLREVINTGNITTIKANAFANCVNLLKFTFSDNFIIVGPNAFNNCPKLKNITFTSNTPRPQYKEILQQIPSVQNIYVPQDAVQAFKTHSGWLDYASKIKPIEQ